MNYHITHSRKDGPDPDFRLDAFRVVPDGEVYTLQAVIDAIDRGFVFVTTTLAGQTTRVRDYIHPRSRRRYLKTDADGLLGNNLALLPDC